MWYHEADLESEDENKKMRRRQSLFIGQDEKVDRPARLHYWKGLALGQLWLKKKTASQQTTSEKQQFSSVPLRVYVRQKRWIRLTNEVMTPDVVEQTHLLRKSTVLNMLQKRVSASWYVVLFISCIGHVSQTNQIAASLGTIRIVDDTIDLDYVTNILFWSMFNTVTHRCVQHLLDS